MFSIFSCFFCNAGKHPLFFTIFSDKFSSGRCCLLAARAAGRSAGRGFRKNLHHQRRVVPVEADLLDLERLGHGLDELPHRLDQLVQTVVNGAVGVLHEPLAHPGQVQELLGLPSQQAVHIQAQSFRGRVHLLASIRRLEEEVPCLFVWNINIT